VPRRVPLWPPWPRSSLATPVSAPPPLSSVTCSSSPPLAQAMAAPPWGEACRAHALLPCLASCASSRAAVLLVLLLCCSCYCALLALANVCVTAVCSYAMPFLLKSSSVPLFWLLCLPELKCIHVCFPGLITVCNSCKLASASAIICYIMCLIP
jgi:hypothetical protein